MSLARLLAAVLLPATVLLVTVGCQTGNLGSRLPAELCNTPGRQALAERITDRGGRLVPGDQEWDGSVDATTRQKMGQPLSQVILPQDRFSNQDIAEAKAAFPEAQVGAPLTLDDGAESAEGQ